MRNDKGVCNYVVNCVSLETLQKTRTTKSIMKSCVEYFTLHVVNPVKELFSNHELSYPGYFSSKAPRFDLDRQSAFRLCLSITQGIISLTYHVSSRSFFHNSTYALITQHVDPMHHRTINSFIALCFN